MECSSPLSPANQTSPALPGAAWNPARPDAGRVALDAVKVLNGKGITASLDLLGESVTDEREAREAGRQYLHILDLIHERRLDANVSVKLTALGQDVSDAVCLDVITKVLDCARSHRTFVRLDMESSAYTQRTLDLFYGRLYPAYRENVGIVLQSWIHPPGLRCVSSAEK